LQILDPLKVGDNDAARVAEHIGNENKDFPRPLSQDRVGLGCGRGRSLLARMRNSLIIGGIGAGDLAFESGRNEECRTGGSSNLFIGKSVRPFGEPPTVFVLCNVVFPGPKGSTH